MKTENREERERRFNGSLELRTVRGREREREREKKKQNTLFQKLLLKIYTIHVCVFNAHFYTSPYKD